MSDLRGEVETRLRRPRVERLKDGIRIVVAGPPNAGKSTLINALIGREVAITSAVPGTTRDVIEAPASIAGVPVVFTDTAGLRTAEDEVERIGVARAQTMIAAADLILWLGDDEPPAGENVIPLHAKADLSQPSDAEPRRSVSAVTGQGLGALLHELGQRCRTLLPTEGEVTLNGRQAEQLEVAMGALRHAEISRDLLIVAEELRAARVAVDRITGRSGVEEMLDTLFARFCIGK